MSLSRDLRAIQGQALEMSTWPALPSAQHEGEKIASVLESAAITSALLQEDVFNRQFGRESLGTVFTSAELGE
jgi:hypothetical protein